MKPIRILVCGTNYGRSYVQAIGREPRAYVLAGILARGSSRSHSLARTNDVPLWKTPENLPSDIDLACAALPSSASRVVLGLLDRKIHVLCEHPQTARFLKSALKKARVRGVCFHLNGHFADLISAQTFIRKCCQVLKRDTLEFIEVIAADRALYAALDILRRSLGSVDCFLRRAARSAAPFSTLVGSMGDVPAVFSVQTSRRADHHPLRDSDSRYLADLRLSIAFRSGTLAMLSVAGPVIWNANYARQGAKAGPLWEVLSGAQPARAAQVRRQRIDANRRAIASLLRAARKGATFPEQSPEHLLEVSRAWEKLGRMLRR